LKESPLAKRHDIEMSLLVWAANGFAFCNDANRLETTQKKLNSGGEGTGGIAGAVVGSNSMTLRRPAVV
jgi:hypothetical protein